MAYTQFGLVAALQEINASNSLLNGEVVHQRKAVCFWHRGAVMTTL